MGIKITTHAESLTLDLNGMSADRKKARIKFSDIRSIVADIDEKTVEIIFSSNEIYFIDFNNVEDFDGLTVQDQNDLYSKLEAKIFV